MDFRDKSKKTFVRIFGFVNNYWGLLFLCFGLNIMYSAFETMSIALIKPIFQIIFDKGMPPASDLPINSDFFASLKDSFYQYVQKLIYNPNSLADSLVNLSFLIISIFVFKNIFKYMASITGAKVNEGIVKNIRDEIFKKLTSLQVDFFGRSRQGHIISTVTNDVNTMNGTAINSFTVMLKEFTQIILFMFLLLSISPYLTLISFSTSISGFLLLRAAIKYLRKYAARMQMAMALRAQGLQSWRWS